MKKQPPIEWAEDQPIYKQLMERLVTRIINGTYVENEALPSVRGLAAEFQVNPLTVVKAYKEFARDGFTERMRGEGLLLRKGVREKLLKRERTRLLKEEWPQWRARLQLLGIKLKELEEIDE